MSKKTTKAENTALVYCGPTVRGVVKRNTVFSGGIPDNLRSFLTAHPEAQALMVPVERFPQTRRAVETAGTAEAILFQKIMNL